MQVRPPATGTEIKMRVTWAGLDELLSCPFLGWVLCDVDVDISAPIVREDHEAVPWTVATLGLGARFHFQSFGGAVKTGGGLSAVFSSNAIVLTVK